MNLGIMSYSQLLLLNGRLGGMLSEAFRLGVNTSIWSSYNRIWLLKRKIEAQIMLS